MATPFYPLGLTCVLTQTPCLSPLGGREEEAGDDAGAEGEAAGVGVGRRRRNQEVRLRGEQKNSKNCCYSFAEHYLHNLTQM